MLMKEVIPVTDLTRQGNAIVRRVREKGAPVLITQRGRSAAVLVSAENYFEVMDRLSYLEDMQVRAAIAIGEAQLARGEGIPHEQVVVELERRWASQKGQ